MRALLLVWFGLSVWAEGAESPPPELQSPITDQQSPITSLKLVHPLQHSGMADASAAVVVSSNLFVVANDEDNILRLYRSDQPGRAIQEFDFSAFLGVEGKSQEADLEGAARVGDRAFWISSHGRNRDGKQRLNRGRLFATDIKLKGGKITLVPAGKPCTTLLEQLIADSQFTRFHFAEAAQRAPKEPDAFNIEGLSATPEGHLLIGLRNPIPDGKALLIPLLNPNDVIEGKPAQFAPAFQLDLGGRGIRDVALYGGTYMIVAGSSSTGGNFKLYQWTGNTAKPQPFRVPQLNDYHPEALIIYPHLGLQAIQILSDDGTKPIAGVPGKEVKEPPRKTFRSFWVVR